MAIMTYNESNILLSIQIILNFDDNTKQERVYKIGDQINIDYIHNKELRSIFGTLKRITSPNGIVLVIDASTKDNSIVENVPIDNIRRLNDVQPVLSGSLEAIDGLTPIPMISGNNAIFTGNIAYVNDVDISEGNVVAIKIKAPTGIDTSKIAVRFESNGLAHLNTSAMVLKCKPTASDEIFKVFIKWYPEAIEDVYNIIIADAILIPKV